MAKEQKPTDVRVSENFEELFERLDFRPNDNGKAGNFDAQIVSATTLIAGFTVNHKLERVPTGFIVIEKDAAVDVFTSSDMTDSALSLKATVDNVTVRILIL